MPRKKKPRFKCVHCKLHPRAVRQLCRDCFVDTRIRDMYPVHGWKEGKAKYALPRGMPEPTLFPPGTPEKIEILRLRVVNRQELWHPKDAKRNDDLIWNTGTRDETED